MYRLNEQERLALAATANSIGLAFAVDDFIDDATYAALDYAEPWYYAAIQGDAEARSGTSVARQAASSDDLYEPEDNWSMSERSFGDLIGFDRDDHL
jgi:hypothetical protein